MPPTIPGLPASVADKLPAGLLDKVKKPLIAILVVIAGSFGLNAAGVFDGDDDKGDTPATTVVVDSTDATDDSSLTSMVDPSTSVDDSATSTSVDDSATSTSVDDSATSTSVDDSTPTSVDSSLPAAGEAQAAAAKTIVEGFAIEGITLDPSCVATESASLSDVDATAVIASLNSDTPPTIEGGFGAFLERLIKCEVPATP